MTRTFTSDTAARIRPDERDTALNLGASDWPRKISLGTWTYDAQRKTLARRHTIGKDPNRYIWEELLRFPTAPLYGVDREYPHQVRTEPPFPAVNFHSLRLLSLDSPPESIKRVYLLHNGLNELDSLRFYYQITDLLSDRDSVCLLRPLPGHLTRMPFHGAYSEKPFDRYLRDAGELFRQFLRFMIESQWLLSIIAPREAYIVPSGASLLSPGDKTPGQGRSRASTVAESIVSASEALRKASRKRLADPDRAGEPASLPIMLDIVEVLRARTGIADIVTSTDPPSRTDPERPSIHAIGYSLGGSFAQSVFFSWPFLVASCTSLFSGGPLKDVALTSFAHPEEWQSVLHALRYELDSALQDPRRFAHSESSSGPASQSHLAGVENSFFEFLLRVFYEVFEQNFTGPIKSRWSEYNNRLLFVVGGSDPIVSPRSVQDSAPAEGLNLIEVAQLTHFVGSSARGDDEARQREFWLPEAARLIANFARRTEEIHAESLHSRWLDSAYQSPVEQQYDAPGRDSDRSLGEVASGALGSPAFEKALDYVSQRVKDSEGFLIIARSDVPTVFLPPSEVRRRGSFLHHADDRVVRYLLGVQNRREALTADRVAVLLPASWRTMLADDSRSYPAQSETPGGQLPRTLSEEDVCEFASQVLSTLSAYELHPQAVGSQGQANDIDTLLTALKTFRKVDRIWVTTLPDVWLWLSPVGTQIVLDRVHNHRLDSLLQSLVPFAAKALANQHELVTKRKDDPLYRNELSIVEGLLARGELRIVRVSLASYNPRYRGQLLSDAKAAIDIICHLALAYHCSTAFVQPDT